MSAKVNVNGEKRFQRETKAQTNLLHTHFFIVFDFIFCDDTVGLLGFLPGQLDAALLHFLLDDLADLGGSCIDKNMSISRGQPSLHAHAYSLPQISRTDSSANTQRHSRADEYSWDASKCLHLMIKISITVQTAEDSVALASGKLQHVDYELQFSSINSDISSGTSRHLLSLMTELFQKPLRGREVYL